MQVQYRVNPNSESHGTDAVSKQLQFAVADKTRGCENDHTSTSTMLRIRRATSTPVPMKLSFHHYQETIFLDFSRSWPRIDASTFMSMFLFHWPYTRGLMHLK